MSRLDELIAELCPEGVEYKSLGEICEIRSGWGFPNVEQGKLEGNYPFYKVSDMNLVGNEMLMTIANNYIDISTASRLGCKPAPEGTIIFPKIGAAIGTNKKRLLSKESCYDNNIMGLIPSEVIISRYLFYQMSLVNLNNFADYSGAMPSIRKTTIEKYIIPLPPLPIQREIVRILDTFTELTAELAAELTARKKQYEYYREVLLDLNGNKKSVTLNEVCKISRGRVMSKEYLRDNSGDFPVYSSQTANRGIFGYINNYDFEDESITWTTDGANAGSVFYHINEKFSITNVCGLLRVVEKDRINTKYLYYVLQVAAKGYVNSGMGNPKLMSNVMASVGIPVPPLSEQRRIVAILDRFDALCNDLTSGLPAEIEARRKQYEYYRDKLLTFKRKDA